MRTVDRPQGNTMKKALAALAFALPAAALADPPNACELLTPEEISTIAERKVEHVVPQKAGNPTQCGFLDSRKAAVLVVSVREVKYAVRDELFQERDNLEKIYKSRSKQLDTVNVTFSTPKNQNELDTSQIARMIEARIK